MMNLARAFVLIATIPVVALGLSLAADDARKKPDKAKNGGVTADLAPTKGSKVEGKVTFTPDANGGVRMVAELSGLTPGDHGFHIHEKGDCSADDASSAGAHFDPTRKPHGAPGPEHHVGDLGNIKADASGKARLEAHFPQMSLDGENGIVGRAVIVHAQPDDLKTQPSGASGGRQACGVLKAE